MPGNWIAGAVKHKGALRKELGAKPGQPIPKAKLANAAKAPGKEGKRARLAETLEGMHGKQAAPKHDPKTMSYAAGKKEPVKTDRGDFAFRKNGRG
jgi:hypothetical protein